MAEIGTVQVKVEPEITDEALAALRLAVRKAIRDGLQDAVLDVLGDTTRAAHYGQETP